MLRQGEILTLNDNKNYLVVYTTEINLKKYAYLIEQDNYTNTMFCKYDNNNGLEKVIESEIIQQILIKFKEEINR